MMALADQTKKGFRFERKFSTNSLSLVEVISLVKSHPAIFRVGFPDRQVNNLYFDSVQMQAFTDNVEGLANRTKIRIRWYGDLFGLVEKPTLELKIKRGNAGSKKHFPLAPIRVDDNIHDTAMNRLKGIDGLLLEERLELAKCRPVLITRYVRKYFLSTDGRFRITVDSGLMFYTVNRFKNRFLRCSHNDDIVIELKYDAEQDDTAHKISSHLGYRLSKYSKYATGVQICSPGGTVNLASCPRSW